MGLKRRYFDSRDEGPSASSTDGNGLKRGPAHTPKGKADMTEVLFALSIGILFGIGVFQLLRRDLIKAAIGFAILFSAINLFFVAVGAFEGDFAPYVSNVEAGRQTSDPLIQALILTAIVVSFGSFSLVLGFVNIISRRYDTVDSNDINKLKH